MSRDEPVVGPVPDGRDAESYDRLRRRVLWSLPTGLYVVGSAAGGRRNLMTTSWVTQVATVPKLVAASVEVAAVTHALIEESGGFAVTVLPRAERAVIRKFVKPVRPDEVEVDEGRGEGTMHGEPVALGSPTLVVGEVLDCGFGRPGDPSAPTEAPAELLRMEDTRMSYGG